MCAWNCAIAAPVSPLRAKASILASDRLRSVWFDLSYYSASSPIGVKAVSPLPTVWTGATGYALCVGTELLLCLLELVCVFGM